VKTTADKTESCQVVLNIEVEPEELEDSMEQAYRRLVSKTAVPGFRKGKAPRHLLERYLGRSALLDEALDRLLPKLYEQALREQGIEAIAQPQFEITQLDPVIFKVTVPTRPTVELGDYRELRIAPEPVEITEEQVDEVLDRLRHVHATWLPVERAAQLGDLVAIDVEGRIGDKTVLSEKGRWYQLLPDSPLPVPGFAEKLEGMGKDEEREFTLSIPSEHPDTEVAGKECLFKVLVSEVKEEHLPELDDAFAKSLGPEIENMELFRERIAADLKASRESRAKMELEEKIIDAIAAMSHIEYPAVLAERELERLVATRRERLGGQKGLEAQLKLRGKTEEEFRNELQPVAERLVLRSLILDKVSESESIEVSDAEVDAEIERLSAGENGEQVRQFFSSPLARNSLKGELLTRKAMAHLVQTATKAATEEIDEVQTATEAATEEIDE
jgi:trigger factor